MIIATAVCYSAGGAALLAGDYDMAAVALVVIGSTAARGALSSRNVTRVLTEMDAQRLLTLHQRSEIAGLRDEMADQRTLWGRLLKIEGRQLRHLERLDRDDSGPYKLPRRSLN